MPRRVCRPRRAPLEDPWDQVGSRLLVGLEVLLQALDQEIQTQRQSFTLPESELYEGGLTVVLRLLFLVCAEQEGLLPLGHPIYDQHYSLSCLRKQLQEQLHEQAKSGSEACVPKASCGGSSLNATDNPYQLWTGLLSIFRVLHEGVCHKDFTLIAYGGRLFDPERFPWLTVSIHNRTVHCLLESLPTKIEIDQLGPLFEMLLGYTVRRTSEPYLHLSGIKNKEPIVPLSELERRNHNLERPSDELLAYLHEQTGRTYASLQKAFAARSLNNSFKRVTAPTTLEEELRQRVQPFIGLIRTKNSGKLRTGVIPSGSIYVVPGTNRSSSGTHYTPRSLTEPLIQHTLEPLVYEGAAEGLPRKDWRLRSVQNLLKLKVCDMACGSGAFLLEVCRYLAVRVQEALAQELEESTDGHPSECALQLVARNCLYGVERNPLALELAKLSLWLLTRAKDRPFRFLDSALRCGDALVGITEMTALEQVVSPPLSPSRLLAKVLESRQQQQGETKAKQTQDLLDRLKLLADLLIANQLTGLDSLYPDTRILDCLQGEVQTGLRQKLDQTLAGLRLFHWPLEFPEVMADATKGGFDAFICNPPFINAIEGETSESVEAVKAWLKGQYRQLTGTADLSYFFVARLSQMSQSHPPGQVQRRCITGLIVPRPFLNAPSARKLRANLLKSYPPTLIYCPEGPNLFRWAKVRVAALTLGGRNTCWGGKSFPLQNLSVRSDNWWESIAQLARPAEESDLCISRSQGTSEQQTLGQHFEVLASMTAAMAYEILPFLSDDGGKHQRLGERSAGAKRDELRVYRLVTTGLIDPSVCLWGQIRCKYLKHEFSTPQLILSTQMSTTVQKRLGYIRRPKVLIAGVAGPGDRVEAFVDREGIYCGAVSTFTVLDPDDDVTRLENICKCLNSEATALRVSAQLGATAMASGLVTITKHFLRSLPLKEGIEGLLR